VASPAPERTPLLNSFHSFVIVKNNEGKAVLLFKAWCTSEWDGKRYEPVVLLHDLPQDVPEIIKPNYDAVDFGRLKSMVDKCVNNGVFTNEEKKEWLNFLEEEEITASIYEDVEEIVYDKDDGKLKYALLFCIYF